MIDLHLIRTACVLLGIGSRLEVRFGIRLFARCSQSALAVGEWTGQFAAENRLQFGLCRIPLQVGSDESGQMDQELLSIRNAPLAPLKAR